MINSPNINFDKMNDIFQFQTINSEQKSIKSNNFYNYCLDELPSLSYERKENNSCSLFDNK